jgi:hypothetical protein
MHRFAALLWLAALPLAAQAQTTTPTPESAGPRISPAIGVHYGSPLRLSGALGLLVDRSGDKNDGMIVMAELGQQGGQFSLGYFRMFGWFGSGYSLRGAVLRTGEDPWNATAHTTYAGVELHGMLIFGVGGRVGYMRRVSSTVTGAQDNVVPVGISIGF